MGSGLYGMLIFAILAVFIAGLMVGRTPEYLGKKIGPYEMKMAVLVRADPAAGSPAGHAPSPCSRLPGRRGWRNAGPHGFSEILYAFSSMGNNNGCAFAGYGAPTPVLYAVLGGVVMLVARLLAHRPGPGHRRGPGRQAPGAGQPRARCPPTARSSSGLLIGIVILVGALTFFPALALGPIVEQLLLHAGAPASRADVDAAAVHAPHPDRDADPSRGLTPPTRAHAPRPMP